MFPFMLAGGTTFMRNTPLPSVVAEVSCRFEPSTGTTNRVTFVLRGQFAPVTVYDPLPALAMEVTGRYAVPLAPLAAVTFTLRSVRPAQEGFWSKVTWNEPSDF